MHLNFKRSGSPVATYGKIFVVFSISCFNFKVEMNDSVNVLTFDGQEKLQSGTYMYFNFSRMVIDKYVHLCIDITLIANLR